MSSPTTTAEHDLQPAALSFLRTLSDSDLALVTMRQLKQAVQEKLKLSEGALDQEPLKTALRQIAQQGIQMVKDERKEEDAPLHAGVKREQQQQQQQQTAPAAKKARTAILDESPAATTRASRGDSGASVTLPAPDSDGAYVFQLDDPLLRASVKTFKGMTLIDVRKFYTDQKTGQIKPTSKGISMKPEQWDALKAHIDRIDAAIHKFG